MASEKKDGLGAPINLAANYYVQDTRQVVGNCVSWWGIARKGYVCDIYEAGIYLGADVVVMRDTDLPWPEDVVLGAIVRHVRVEALQRVAKGEN